MQNQDQIEFFIKNFISPARAERYLTLLAGSTKQRNKVVIFTDPPDFISERRRDISNDVKAMKDYEKVAYVFQHLVALGAPEESILWSQGTKVDEVTNMPLADAVKDVIDTSAQFNAAIIMCIPGKLAFYQGEWADECYILERK